jgi:GT2 family glycosyltransferase
MKKASQPGISVIICAYTQQRWKNLQEVVASVREQRLAAGEIVVVVDHNQELFERIERELPEVIVVENTEKRGLSGARNSGVARARYSIIAFLDDDVTAGPDWLSKFWEGFRDPSVLGIGGGVHPSWGGARWFPEEFLWVIGCSYRGMPQKADSIRNPIGANMAFRREVFEEIGGFRSEIGRRGNWPGGCEETELCIRAHQRWPERKYLYIPEASVEHHIAVERITWGYFCRRCYYEGYSKAYIRKYVGIQEGLSSERSYTFKVLPRAIVREIAESVLRRNISGVARSLTIVLGLAMTATGYLVGEVCLRGGRDTQRKRRVERCVLMEKREILARGQIPHA